MIIILLLLMMPAASCLCWVLFNTVAARRTITYGMHTALYLMLALFLLADPLYVAPGISPDLLVFTRLIELAAAPCLVPLVWMYMNQLKYGKRFGANHYAWVILPVFFLTAGGFLTQLAGTQDIAQVLETVYDKGLNAVGELGSIEHSYFVWTVIVFRIVLGIELAIGVGYCLYYARKHRISPVNIKRFFYNGEKCSVLELQIFNLIVPAVIVLVKVLVSNSFLSEHVWFQVLLAFIETMCVFNFAFVALCGAREKITRENLRHILVYNYNPKIKSVIVEFTMDDLLEDAERDGLKRLQEKIGETLELGDGDDIKPSTNVTEMLFATMANTWDDDSLISRFQHLMLNEQLFLQPGLSLGDVADKLHTNKTYVSKLVNNTYNLGFPELLNTLRIDYAEQYILTHKNAKQTEIAEACGFQSASSFNSIFKKVTGMTPKVWIASLDQNNPAPKTPAANG